MKKYIFMAAALMMMGMSSCSNENEVMEQTEQTPQLTKLVFTVNQGAQTRAAWGADGFTPVFEDGDKVSLLSENNDNVELTVNVDGAGIVTLNGWGVKDENMYFCYPYADHLQMTDGKISSKENGNPAEPYYYNALTTITKEGIPSPTISFAKSTDSGTSPIQFKNLMAMLKFIPNADVTNSLIDLWSVDDSNIFPVGKMYIDVATGTADWASKTDNITTNIIDFESGKPYYMAVPPFSTSDRVLIANDSEDLYLKKPSGLTIEAGKMYTINWRREY